MKNDQKHKTRHSFQKVQKNLKTSYILKKDIFDMCEGSRWGELEESWKKGYCKEKLRRFERKLGEVC